MNRYRKRLRERLAMLPFGFPPAVIVTSDLAMSVVVVGALVQRSAVGSLSWPVVVGAVIALSHVLLAVLGSGIPPRWVLVAWIAVSGLVGTGLLLTRPVPADIAPLVLDVMAGEVAATSPRRVSVPVAGIAMTVLAVPAVMGRLDNAPMYLVLVALGWSVGFMVRTQLTVFEQERQLQADRAARAAGDERRRIAREVHDVIAHSLSVTLLQLTGARRALQVDRDVDEAVAALADAERIGRQAMSDIRRTVGLLESPAGLAPEPSVDEIEDLVADFVRAGVAVKFEMVGDIDTVSAATGLALYRIAQESLANVAKHAPGADVAVRLRVGRTVELIVDNDIPRPSTGTGHGGTGVAGMGRRAELSGGTLTAGPVPDGWRVHAEFPLRDEVGR